MKAVFGLSLLATVLAVATSTVSAQEGHCGQYTTCADCISHNLCGWCSEPVTYPNNTLGPRCAGFNQNGSHPFTCTGIYNTEKCEQGYRCNRDNFTCELTKPGGGHTLEECQANCTNEGEVYLCNHTTKKCHQVPSGTPGASSKSVCEASCVHPSMHPSSPSPSNHTASTYLCNMSTGTCQKTTPGHGGSKSVCEQTCKKGTNATYYCDMITHSCVKLAPGTPGGVSKELCNTQCKPKVNPGPPAQFLGTWRGIAIQKGYKTGEWDMQFDQTSATIVNVREATTIKGVPFNVINGDQIDLWLNVTSGPGAGQVIKAIGTTEDRGPETSFLSAAFSPPGGKTPASITVAMTDGSSTVYFLSECAGTPECIFTLPATAPGIEEKTPTRRVSLVEKLPEILKAQQEKELVGEDPCSAYSANCSYCIAHEYCGWCSQDVTYKNGREGTQCAGFSSSPNKTNGFICQGQFSTTECNVGYECAKNLTCVPNPVAGNGQPLAVCQAECRPTPAPTHVEEYLCNLTTKKCHKCNETFCPGAMPQSQCAASCVKPHHGPSTMVAGMWRGIEINEHYSLGEFDMVFNASEVAAYHNGKVLWNGTIDSYGGDVMIFKLAEGKVPAIYSVADQSGMYSIMTIAFGTPNGDIPQGFAPPMETTGMYEWVLAKCLNAPCDFHFPNSQ